MSTHRAALLAALLFGSAVAASDDRKSQLLPPEGAPLPGARGEVKIEHDELKVRAQGLEATTDYGVFLEAGDGTLVEVGALHASDEGRGEIEFKAGEDDSTENPGDAPEGGAAEVDDHGGEGGHPEVEAEDEHEDEDDREDEDEHEDEDEDEHGGDDGSSEVVGLPFGATTPDQLAGRVIELRDAEGTVILRGMTPDLRFHDEEREGETALLPPDPSTSEAHGEIELREGDSRLLIVVEIEHLEPLTVYEVAITDPATGATESVGAITTDADGEGKLRLDTAAGDAVPFGVGELAALEGFVVAVTDPDGAVVLEGTLSGVEGLPPDSTGDGEHEREDEGETCLAAVDAATGSSGKVEVEIEPEDAKEKLEIEVRGLAPSTVYVVTIATADGAVEELGQLTTNRFGRGELELEFQGDAPRPLGAASLADLAGLEIGVASEDGTAVLTGSVPSTADQAECASGGDGGDGPGDDHGDDGDDDAGDDHGDHHGGDDGDDGDDDDHAEDHGGDSGDDSGDDSGAAADGGALGLVLVPDRFLVVGPYDAPFLRGDSNQDAAVDVSDAIHSFSYLFSGGPAPACYDAADTNDDGALDISDPIFTLLVLFRGEREISEPGTFVAGFDRTADALHCEDPSAR